MSKWLACVRGDGESKLGAPVYNNSANELSHLG